MKPFVGRINSYYLPKVIEIIVRHPSLELIQKSQTIVATMQPKMGVLSMCR
jgi:hypothetical protein